MAGALVLLGGPGAQAAGACGSDALAHRGAHSPTVDENTLESIERAFQLGAWTENDVFLSKDGAFVIIHNQGIGHMTDCVGDIKDMTLAEIKACPTQPNNQQIPTAEEAFATLAGNQGQKMNLEVKGPGWWANNNAKLAQLYDAAVSAGVQDRVYFSNDATYRLLTAMYAASSGDALTAWKPDPDEPNFTKDHAKQLHVAAVMAWSTQWTSAKVKAFKNAGLQTWGKRSDKQTVWQRNWKLGLKAQLTNQPGTYKKWCDSVA